VRRETVGLEDSTHPTPSYASTSLTTLPWTSVSR